MSDHWQRIINHRQQLIDRLANLNIIIDDPDDMKTKQLEALLNNHAEVKIHDANREAP